MQPSIWAHASARPRSADQRRQGRVLARVEQADHVVDHAVVDVAAGVDVVALVEAVAEDVLVDRG